MKSHFRVLLQTIDGSFNYETNCENYDRSKIHMFTQTYIQRIENNDHTITIQSLITFMVNNIEYFSFNFYVHSINTRN